MCNLRNITINLGLLKRMKKVKVTSIFNRIGQKNSVLVEVSGFEKVFFDCNFSNNSGYWCNNGKQ